MKKQTKKGWLLAMVLFTTAVFALYPVVGRSQVGIIEIIKIVTVKVIKAIDLKIQRLQNKTIWLQNAQKTLENTLSKMKLKEIAEWQQKQQAQYQKYYQELSKVKGLIATYQRVREITKKQVRLVENQQQAWQLLRKDKHFSSEELKDMERVYGGILAESLRNMDQVKLAVSSFSTQMSDGKRLELINLAADGVDQNFDDLVRFNQQNVMLSVHRSKSQQEVDQMRKIYNIP